MPQSILITGVTFLLCGGIASPLPAFLSTAPGLLPSAGRLPAGPRDGLDRKIGRFPLTERNLACKILGDAPCVRLRNLFYDRELHLEHRVDEDKYPPYPAQRAAVLVRGGEGRGRISPRSAPLNRQ